MAGEKGQRPFSPAMIRFLKRRLVTRDFFEALLKLFLRFIFTEFLQHLWHFLTIIIALFPIHFKEMAQNSTL